MPIIVIYLLILIYVIFFSLWVPLFGLEVILKVASSIDMGNITFLRIIKEAKMN